MSSDKQFYYELGRVDSDSGQFQRIAGGAVSLSSDPAVVLFLQDAVKAKNSRQLANVESYWLQVFKNRAAFEANSNKPLKFGASVVGMGGRNDPLLVVVSELSDAPSPTKKMRTAWETTQIKALEEDNATAEFFTLDSAYLLNSGLEAFSSGSLILYRRQAFRDQFKFLQEDVIDSNGKMRLGWILGPPGTGKSIAALAFASTLTKNNNDNNDNGWAVTWLHLGRTLDALSCVQYHGLSKKSCQIIYRTFSDLHDVLDQVNEDQQHIIFLDGYVDNETNHAVILTLCNFYRKKNQSKRRLVVVSSMPNRFNCSNDEDGSNNLKEFVVYSWTLDEYLAAAKDDAFFDSIKANLDSSDEEIELLSREDLIESKFYFAGGNSQYMFLEKTERVLWKLGRALATVPNFKAYSSVNVTDGSALFNLLFSYYHDPNSQFGGKKRIVSGWVASQLAIQCGPELPRHLARNTYKESNPALDGWLFEIWFFAYILEDGVEISHNHLCHVDETWPPCTVEVRAFSLSNFPVVTTGDSGVWLKPRNWNQGGYDAIFLREKDALVRFVQITRGTKHSFSIGFFQSFLNKLEATSPNFDANKIRLEIVFLVDPKEIKGFEFESVSGLGKLSKYGWPKGKETKMVKVFGIKNWYV